MSKSSKNEFLWCYLGDYEYLEDNIAPLFHCSNYDEVTNGVIIIYPETLEFRAHFEKKRKNYNSDEMHNHGRLLKINIPKNISGEALVEIFHHPEFISLLEKIKKGYVLKSNKGRKFGKLSKYAKIEVEQFQNWLKSDFGIKHRVDEVECGYNFIQPVKYFNQNGDELIRHQSTIPHIKSITICDGEYYIYPKTDIDILVNIINKDVPDLFIMNLKEEICLEICEYFWRLN